MRELTQQQLVNLVTECRLFVPASSTPEEVLKSSFAKGLIAVERLSKIGLYYFHDMIKDIVNETDCLGRLYDESVPDCQNCKQARRCVTIFALPTKEELEAEIFDSIPTTSQRRPKGVDRQPVREAPASVSVSPPPLTTPQPSPPPAPPKPVNVTQPVQPTTPYTTAPVAPASTKVDTVVTHESGVKQLQESFIDEAPGPAIVLKKSVEKKDRPEKKKPVVLAEEVELKIEVYKAIAGLGKAVHAYGEAMHKAALLSADVSGSEVKVEKLLEEKDERSVPVDYDPSKDASLNFQIALEAALDRIGKITKPEFDELVVGLDLKTGNDFLEKHAPNYRRVKTLKTVIKKLKELFRVVAA